MNGPPMQQPCRKKIKKMHSLDNSAWLRPLLIDWEGCLWCQMVGNLFLNVLYVWLPVWKLLCHLSVGKEFYF